MTDIGLIATLPEGSGYSFTVSGSDAANVGAEIYTYDASELEPVRTVDFASLPISDGESCTVFIPMDEYDDYYAKDGSGNIYAPDSDSENPDLAG